MGKKIALIVLGAIVAIMLLTGFTTVREGQIGVKYRFGSVVDTGLGAGLHYHIPVIEKVSKIDITEQVYATDTTAYTKDTQTAENNKTLFIKPLLSAHNIEIDNPQDTKTFFNN